MLSCVHDYFCLIFPFVFLLAVASFALLSLLGYVR